jgi:hypothetical protein
VQSRRRPVSVSGRERKPLVQMIRKNPRDHQNRQGGSRNYEPSRAGFSRTARWRMQWRFSWDDGWQLRKYHRRT